MTTQQQIDGLLSAKTKISLVRAHHTQFDLPLADEKLVRVNRYLTQQLAELERQQWQEAGLIEVMA